MVPERFLYHEVHVCAINLVDVIQGQPVYVNLLTLVDTILIPYFVYFLKPVFFIS